MTYLVTLEIDDNELAERLADAEVRPTDPHEQVNIIRDFGTVHDFWHEDPPGGRYTSLVGTLEA